MTLPTVTAPNESASALPINHQLLGVIAMLGAPAMTIEAARHGFTEVMGKSDLLGALLYALFALGWWASLLGLWQLRATGNSRVGRAVLALPLVTVTLALMQSPLDLLPVATTNPVYIVTDLAWPLSMLLTLAVGVTALVARRLPGWKRYVPLYCGLSVPVALALMAFGVDPFALFPYVTDVHIVSGWALLGYVVFSTTPHTLTTSSYPR